MKSDLRDYAHQSGVPETTGGTRRTTESGAIVSKERGRQMAEALGAEGYLECSAKQDIDSVHELFKVLSMTSLRYTALTKSNQNDELDRGHYRRNHSARKNSFSMPITRNYVCIADSVTGRMLTFWTVKQRPDCM